jgi:hypothetical protein
MDQGKQEEKKEIDLAAKENKMMIKKGAFMHQAELSALLAALQYQLKARFPDVNNILLAALLRQPSLHSSQSSDKKRRNQSCKRSSQNFS